ncbi:MAG: triose-phosphate isomerase [Anaerolineaceae bacterium]|nr:triose-phosphate isomerase [Anaerolineaceae bacterium]
MRRPLVAGNWKMNKTAAQAVALVNELMPGLKGISDVERVVCPPFTSLPSVHDLLKNTEIGLGAQNMHFKASGAYTGEVSPEMVKEFCQYVILGHSERRQYFAETDATVNEKVKAALAMGLTPIVCVGETEKEYDAGETKAVVTRQILAGFAGIAAADAEKIVVAYEPIWAIGTGKAATAEGANAVLKDSIRPAMSQLWGEAAAQSIRILYGGSVSAANAAEYFKQPDIDGALVGGASLKPADFVTIVTAAKK